MKKIMLLLVGISLCFCIVACEVDDTIEELNVLVPAGATSLAFVSVYDEINETGKIDVVDGSDVLIAELSKTDSEYDVIVAPINVGASLIASDSCEYKMIGAITWGNLYLVGQEDVDFSEVEEIALFGQNTVPQLVFDEADLETNATLTYYSSATLVQQQLLAENVTVGLLAEPLASATIAAASASGIELSIVYDLQEAYGDEGYPQAMIFVKEDSDYQTLIDKIDEFTNNDYPEMEELLTEIGVETLGLPSVEIAMTSLDRQNIRFVYASTITEEIKDFLELFTITYDDDMIIT